MAYMNVMQCRQSVLDLADELGLPQEVCTNLREDVSEEFLNRYKQKCQAMTDPAAAPHVWQGIEQTIREDDPNGMRALALDLYAAVFTRKKFQRLGIGDAVFVETMRCFSRYLDESKTDLGTYAFNRGNWVWRALSLRLLRIGTLEFEYCTAPQDFWGISGIDSNSPVLMVHIPSDARLQRAILDDTYRSALLFYKRWERELCPLGAPKKVLCRTWLLSEAFSVLLPEESGIRRFAGDFEICGQQPDDESFYRWLFRGHKPPETLPAGSSLQRAVIRHLDHGGKIGIGCGILETEGLSFERDAIFPSGDDCL